jgi:hypothetical protein
MKVSKFFVFCAILAGLFASFLANGLLNPTGCSGPQCPAGSE